MQITVGEDTLNVDIENRSFEESLHTGKRLRNFAISFSASQSRRNRVEELAATARSEGVTALDDEGQVVRFSMKPGGSSYSNGGPVLYQWHLEEREDLSVTTLRIDDLELTPYQYREEFDKDGALSIRARVVLEEASLQRLMELARHGEYFEVVRVGLSDEPKIMRVGRGYWSNKDGVHKEELVLVDRAYDDNRHNRLLGSFDHLAQANLIDRSLIEEQGATLGGLIAVLQAKGVIDDQDLATIEAGRDDREWDIERRFRKVGDLDRWE